MNDLILLAGGFGSRMHKVSNGIPKALLPIGNKYFFDLLIERLSSFNINHIYISLHYEADKFIDYLNKTLDQDYFTAIIEPKPLGTGGAIKYVIENSTISSDFAVINSDTLSEIDLDKMFISFDSSIYPSYIGISKVKDCERYGSVIVENGKVVSFLEKGNKGSSWINNGHYIFNKDQFIDYDNPFSLEKKLLPQLVNQNQLGAYKVYNDNFIDMGIPDDYKKLCDKYNEII